MTLAPLRPRVADLHYALLPTSVSEAAVAERSTTWHGGGFRLRITAAGHSLTWSDRGVTLVETITAQTPTSSLLTLPVRGERRGKLTLDRLQYEIGLQVETLDPEVFVRVHDDLAVAPGLMHRFGEPGRINLAPLSLVSVELVPGGLAVAAFHTFPAEQTIVKTQSLFEFPR